jgi:hypothetical protein
VVMKMSIVFFLVVTSCSVLCYYNLHPEDGGDIFTRNIGNRLHDHMSSQSVSPQSRCNSIIFISVVAIVLSE